MEIIMQPRPPEKIVLVRSPNDSYVALELSRTMEIMNPQGTETRTETFRILLTEDAVVELIGALQVIR